MRNVDAFIGAHTGDWQQLAGLVARARRNPSTLAHDEIDTLVRLHLRVSNHLAVARSHLHDPELVAYLSELVAGSVAVVYGSRPRSWRTALHGLTRTFPAAVWHARHAIMLSAVVFLVAAVTVGWWLAATPAAIEASAPDDVRQEYVETAFAEYYSSEPAVTFAARVFTNNAGVGALAFGSGIAFGVPTLFVLAFNGINVGVAAGLFHAAGDAATFYGLILPHGLLELTAVFVAGGAGLRLGWSVISPGDRPRAEAVAEEGRRSVVIVIALVAVFALAGIIEAFVTPAPWPTAARVGTGAAVWLGLVAWTVSAGRSAARQGRTGALGEESRPAGMVGSAPLRTHQPPRALISR